MSISIVRSNQDLEDLARRLLKDGPVKTHFASQRRIRIEFGGDIVADSTDALYVWEHPYYPALYLPKQAFNDALHLDSNSNVKGANFGELSANGQKTDLVMSFAEGPLKGYVRVEFKAVSWFEEDVPIQVHPKDVFKRIDVLPSSRSIQVELDGVKLADAKFAMHLYETGLPARYYIPMTAIEQRYLRKTDHKTRCPYKGEAEYFDIVLPDGKGGEKEFKNLVWYYNRPNLECGEIKGLACFYNEKVDISVDGVSEGRPKTVFS